MVRWILELLSLFVAAEFCRHGLVRDTPMMVVRESAIPARDGARADWLDRAEGNAVLASGLADVLGQVGQVGFMESIGFCAV
jgi:hypothetical protein